MFFGASRTLAAQFTPASLLDDQDFSSTCGYDGRYDYDDGLYVGFYDLWTACGGTDNPFLVVAAAPPEGDVILLVEVLAVTDADLEAIDRITGSFQVVGTLP
jgi:serine protease Do